MDKELEEIKTKKNAINSSSTLNEGPTVTPGLRATVTKISNGCGPEAH
jgi:hypothetical protein